MSNRSRRRPPLKFRRKTRFALDERRVPSGTNQPELPDELLRLVDYKHAPDEFLRFFESFSDPAWTSNLDPSDLLAVLKINGGLSERVQNEVKDVRMFSKQGISKTGTVVVHVNSTGKARLFGQLLDKLGDSLLSVALDYEAVRTYNLTALSERCRSVKSLALRDKLSEIDLGALLRHCGPNLKRLELEGVQLRDSHVAAITSNCVQLETLRIAYNDWDSVIISPWKTLGNTLKELSLRCPPLLLNSRGAQVDVLTEIKEHCLQLSNIELDYSLNSDFSFAVALCRLQGDRLQVLRLRAAEVFVQKDDIEKIFAACPNVSIDADIWHENRPFRLVNAKRLPR